MVAALRPGGVLLSSECYFGAMRSSPTPALAKVWEAFYEAMPNADYMWAPALPATLRAAGLTDVEASGRAEVMVGGTPVAELLRLTIEAVRHRIPDNVDVDSGAETLRDPAAIEPGIIWYTASGRRSAA